MAFDTIFGKKDYNKAAKKAEKRTRKYLRKIVGRTEFEGSPLVYVSGGTGVIGNWDIADADSNDILASISIPGNNRVIVRSADLIKDTLKELGFPEDSDPAVLKGCKIKVVIVRGEVEEE